MPSRSCTRRDSVRVHAAVRDGQQPGVVVVESIRSNDAFVEGIALNVLISAEAAPPNGGAAFHDTAVWLRPEPAAAPVACHTKELIEA
jgi:anaerobic selenocysteine-containing dehydrogenase